MTAAAWPHYLRNCFWLVLPVLVFNIVFAAQLPPAFQPDVFWADIPPLLALAENLSRYAVMALPLLMPLAVEAGRQRLGLALYAVGLVLYFAAWAPPILWPDSAWSTSVLGFMAPAYAPLLWLTGIGLVGDGGLMRRFPILSWAYFALSALFLLAHNAHTLTIYQRLY